MATVSRKRIFVGYSSVDTTIKGTHYVDLELIKRDLVNHFYTRKGERVMKPEFGSIIWDILFEPMTDDNVQLIVQDSYNIVAQDGRVSIRDIDVLQYDNGLKLQMNLFYQPLDIVEQFTLDFDRRSAESSQT